MHGAPAQPALPGCHSLFLDYLTLFSAVFAVTVVSWATLML